MREVLIFGGTTEGRELAEFCERQGIPAAVSVATEYGTELLGSLHSVRVLEGRRTEEEMRALLKERACALVIDATHPYATAVTESIQAACAAEGTRLLRVLRQSAGDAETALCFASAEEAAEFLQGTEGNILLTTGSKELSAFSLLSRERLYVRVLPGEESLRLCREAALPSAHIAAIQGPFSVEMNVALLAHFHCRYLVTKESGNRGGFLEKLAACRAAGAQAVVIGRPMKEEGISTAQAEQLLLGLYCTDVRAASEAQGRAKKEREPAQNPAFREQVKKRQSRTEQDGLFQKRGELPVGRQGQAEWPEVHLCGLGPGGDSLITEELRELLPSASLLIGAERVLLKGEWFREQSGQSPAKRLASWRAEEIAEAVLHAEAGEKIVVLLSGDSGFYSGAVGVLEALRRRAFPEESVQVHPGISSLSCLAARARIPWEQVPGLSLHGRRQNWLAELRRCGAVFLTLGGTEQLSEITALLTENGLSDCELLLGEELSLPDERLVRCTAGEWKAHAAEAENSEQQGRRRRLAALLLRLPEGPAEPLWPGIPDSCFLRERVPLTKAAVRAAVMSMLRPRRDSLCWDVGSGSGGVTAELSMAAPLGEIYAVECREDAFLLTGRNIQKLGLWNVRQCRGEAPEILSELPAPDYVFVGGSGGRLREILELIYEKNPSAVTAVTAVSLETAAELFHLLSFFEGQGFQTECRQLAAASAEKRGQYSMLLAQNPVYIAVIRGKRKTK